MNDLSAAMQQIEQRISHARSRGDMRLVKRLTSDLQHLRTRAAEFADGDSERPEAPADRGLLVERPRPPAEPRPPAAPAGGTWLATDIPLGPLGAPRRPVTASPSARADGAARPAEGVNLPPTIPAEAAPAPPGVTGSPAASVPPSPPHEPSPEQPLAWAALQLQLPLDLASHARTLFMEIGTPDCPGKGVNLDHVRSFLRAMLSITMAMRYSEGKNLGIQEIDEVEQKLHSPTRTGNDREFPCEQYDSLLDLISSNDHARLRRRATSTEHRCRFLRYLYLLRAKVIHDVQPDKIVKQVCDEEARNQGNNPSLAVETYHNTLVRESRISRADLGAQRFPHALRTLRNATTHTKPDWLLGRPFPAEQFRSGFSQALGMAMIEWISAERWLLEVACGNMKDETRRGMWYELEIPGSPVLFVPKERMPAGNHDRFVIDRVDGSPLFPYYALGVSNNNG